MEMNLVSVAEYVSVGLNVIFLLLLMRENRWCWPFGIVGSAIGVALFLSDDVKLYSEALLYSYYVFIGIYGWWRWKPRTQQKDPLELQHWGLQRHLVLLAGGLLSWLALGWWMHTYRQPNSPFLDAFTTVFSFIASYMQAEKVISSWYIWIVVNALSIWLYTQRELDAYTVLAVIYLIMSFAGLFEWNKRWKAQHIAH